MRIRDLARICLASLTTHKMRSFLTLLGIIIGTTTVIGVAAVISGLESYVQEKVIRLSPDVFVLTRFGIIRSREEFIDALRRPEIDFREHEVLARSLTHARAVGADITTNTAVRYGSKRLADAGVHGSTANMGTLMNIDIEAGRFFSESDERAGLAVAVIGWDIKDELFGARDPIGRDLSIGNSTFRVVGVVAQQGRTLGQNQDNQAWVPISAFRKIWGRRNSVDILIQARGGVPAVASSVDEARAVLRAWRHTPFREPDPFGIVTAENLQTLWRQISTATFLLTLLISGVSLGVGGVVIANIMLVGVTERTNEIGVRLAVGARKRDIRRQFLLEAALLASAGGVIGMVLGTAAAYAVERATGFPTLVTPGLLGMGLVLSLVVGVVAGYFPARHASNLAVVDALRDET